MGISDYQLNGGINSRLEEIVAKSLDASPESIPGIIEELKNRNFRGDLEYLLVLLIIQQCQQRLDMLTTSEGVMDYQEDLRDAINVIQNTLSILQSTVDSLSTITEGKADKADIVDPEWGAITGTLTNQQDLKNALSGKADKADIVDPEWGAITGTLTDQQDLKNALSGKAGIDYVTDAVAQKVDTITFNAFKSNTPTTTYMNTALDKKADNSSVLSLSSTVDNLRTEVSGKASTSYVDTQVATKASTTALNNLSSRVDNLSTQVSSKVGVTWYDDIEVTSSGWSTTVPYTKNIEVEGIRSVQHLFVDLSMQNVTVTSMEAKEEAYACVSKITPGFNALEIKCYKEKPAESFSIKVGVFA